MDTSDEFPPLAAVFMTHFDDIKGQTVAYYSSNGVLQTNIEHTTLPSGLHQLSQDLVCFTHAGLPGAGVFRSRIVEGGRGRRMGTVAVVLAEGSADELFGLRVSLESLYDRLESKEVDPFSALASLNGPHQGDSVARERGERVKRILDDVWERHRAPAPNGSKGGSMGAGVRLEFGAESGLSGTGRAEGAVRALVDGKGRVPADHPTTYLPALLGVLGPQIVPVYKAALSSKRIMIYSPPPLLAPAAFAWCIHAMSLSPSSTDKLGGVQWLGNVGLMDLVELKKRKAWVATTSDAIYRSHPTYDLFIDLSSSPPTLHSAPLPSHPSQPGPKVSYALTDLPLYRSLVLLDSSPPSISAIPSTSASPFTTHSAQDLKMGNSRAADEFTGKSIYARPGGWWLLAFDIFSRAWELCVGVCEYAVGRGRVGAGGIALPHSDEFAAWEEEDARLLGDEEVVPDQSSQDGEAEGDGQRRDAWEVEDEAVRRGRLILRQLHHHTYHLHARLLDVLRVGSRAGGTVGGARGELDEKVIRALVGARVFGGVGEVVFWQDVAREWGVTGTHTTADTE